MSGRVADPDDDRPPQSVGAPVRVTIDELCALAAADERHPPPERPWVLLNMIASLDGAIETDGTSGGLGGPADRALFTTLRGLADSILVGAGTVRAEGYRSPRRGTRARAPRLIIVSARCDLDPDATPFTDAAVSHVVLTTRSAPEDRRRALAQVCDVRIAGDETIDIATALGQLRKEGDEIVLCEGGPSLNHQLAADGLLDELCLTISPRLVGGPSGRLLRGATPLEPPRAFDLLRLVSCDSLLFARHLRASRA